MRKIQKYERHKNTKDMKYERHEIRKTWNMKDMKYERDENTKHIKS